MYLLKMKANGTVDNSFASNGIVKSVLLNPQIGAFYKTIIAKKKTVTSAEQKRNCELWSNNKI